MPLYSFNVEGELRIGTIRHVGFERTHVVVEAATEQAAKQLLEQTITNELGSTSRLSTDPREEPTDPYGNRTDEWFVVSEGLPVLEEAAIRQRTYYDDKWVASFGSVQLLSGYETRAEVEAELLRVLKPTVLTQKEGL